MFIDEIEINIKSGDGGNGAATFRREKSVQFGGPNGGDGGRGGSIIFETDSNINTLIDFKFKKDFFAENGQAGMRKGMHGKDGEDLVIRVPVGTMVREQVSGKLLADLSKAGERVQFLRGGRGGRGNTHFKTSTRQAPKVAEKGVKGTELQIKLELKLLADVALVGYPNVGKSSLINKISAAKSKVANYQFTTLTPKLGVVRLEDEKSFVVADIPGLIEGAHEGRGLGDKFLRHIERCKLIYHLVDIASVDGRDPITDYEKINNELRSYSEKLYGKKQIVLANKMDLLYEDKEYKKFKEYLDEKEIELYPVSVMLNEGLKGILYKTYDMLQNIKREAIEEAVEMEEVFDIVKPAMDEWEIVKKGEDTYEVGGKIVHRLSSKFLVTDDDESLFIFLNIMRENGLEEQLRKAGCKDGATVKLAGLEFDFVE